MVSSGPSYDDELLTNAYANVSLIADKAWTFNREDPFHKLNYSLWTQHCKVNARYKKKEYKSKRVRAVIPDSHLAKYGDYVYNDEREKLYKSNSNVTSASVSNFCWTEITEPWMLPEVEQHFARISCKPRARHEFQDEQEYGLEDIISYDHLPYTIESPAELELHTRITCEAVRALWNPVKPRQFSNQWTQSQYTQKQLPRSSYTREPTINERIQQQVYCTLQYPLIYAETYGIQKSLPLGLTPGVSDFLPKFPVRRYQSIKEPNVHRVQYFPSLNERSYQNELFPYNRLQDHPFYQNNNVTMLPVESNPFVRTPQQWFQKIPSPVQLQISVPSPAAIYTTVQPLRTSSTPQHPLQIQETFSPTTPLIPTPIPVYQRPVELYHETQKKKSQGVDFKNLILLTKNTIKTQRTTRPKNSQKRAASGIEIKRRPPNEEQNVVQWLERSTSSVNSVVTDFPCFKESYDPEKLANNSGSSGDSKILAQNQKSRSKAGFKRSNVKSSATKDDTDTLSGKRLYRDVLTNASANDALHNAIDERYDELEQEAMEQYRKSEESLALKYQELERQAMEQYKSNNVQEVTSSNDSITDKPSIEKAVNFDMETLSEKGCVDGKKCSGLGQCSPRDENKETGKGCFFQPQVTLLRTDSKSQTRISTSLSRSKIRTASLSKSLTALNQNLICQSKKLCKGTSCGKIDRNVRASSKKCLVLMSPAECISDSKIVKRRNSEEIYYTSQTRESDLKYSDKRKLQCGSGDNVTYFQSRKAEVWLSGFWTT